MEQSAMPLTPPLLAHSRSLAALWDAWISLWDGFEVFSEMLPVCPSGSAHMCGTQQGKG